jgi:hypothetical protein
MRSSIDQGGTDMESALGGTLAALTPEEDKLVRAALEGRKLEKYELYNHKWNMRKLEHMGFAKDGTFVAKGHFRHYKMATWDDAVNYHITIKNGEIVDDPEAIKYDHAGDWRTIGVNIVIEYARKKWGNRLPEALDKATLDQLQKYLSEIQHEGSGDTWEDAAQKVVMLIALSAFERMQTVTAYTDADQGGRRQMFAVGAYNANAGELDRVGNDRISSLFVPPGFTVKVCQHENGGGTCFTYTGPRIVNLPAPLNNHVSYVQVSRSGLTVSKPGLTTVRPLVVR